MDEAVTIKKLEELTIFRELQRLEGLSENTRHHLYLRGQQALAVARAIRGTLVVEEQLADLRTKEATLRFQAFQDIVEVAQRRLQIAERQLRDVSEALIRNPLFCTDPTHSCNRCDRQVSLTPTQPLKDTNNPRTELSHAGKTDELELTAIVCPAKVRTSSPC